MENIDKTQSPIDLNEQDVSRRSALKTMGGGALAAFAAMAGVSQAGFADDDLQVEHILHDDDSLGDSTSLAAATRYRNVIYLSGIGYHKKGDIKKHTAEVLKTMEKWLKKAGSSYDNVLKCNVYLADLADYDEMNEVYYNGRWGGSPPARTTVACYGGIPGDSLVEIDCIAVRKNKELAVSRGIQEKLTVSSWRPEDRRGCDPEPAVNQPLIFIMSCRR